MMIATGRMIAAAKAEYCSRKDLLETARERGGVFLIFGFGETFEG